jgi:hypothetical protein
MPDHSHDPGAESAAEPQTESFSQRPQSVEALWTGGDPARLAAALGNRAFARLAAERGALIRRPRALLRQSHHGSPAPVQTGGLPAALFNSDGRLTQADPPHGDYSPEVVVDAETWMGGFLDFHNFTPATPPPLSEPLRPGPSSTASIEGQPVTIRQTARLLAGQSVLDARAGHLRASVTEAEAVEYVRRHYYREAVNPGAAAVQQQTTYVPGAWHFPALGSRGAVTRDPHALQVVPVALVLPGTTANRPGLSATIIFLQPAWYADSPGGLPRLQSLLSGAQLAYNVPLSSQVAWQTFFQLLGGVAFPHAGAGGIAQRQEALGTALVFTVPLGPPHNGQPSDWGQLLLTVPQLTVSHTHTDFPGMRMPSDLLDTLDVSGAVAIAWAPRGFGRWF